MVFIAKSWSKYEYRQPLEIKCSTSAIMTTDNTICTFGKQRKRYNVTKNSYKTVNLIWHLDTRVRYCHKAAVHTKLHSFFLHLHILNAPRHESVKEWTESSSPPACLSRWLPSKCLLPLLTNGHHQHTCLSSNFITFVSTRSPSCRVQVCKVCRVGGGYWNVTPTVHVHSFKKLKYSFCLHTDEHITYMNYKFWFTCQPFSNTLLSKEHKKRFCQSSDLSLLRYLTIQAHHTILSTSQTHYVVRTRHRMMR